MAYNKEEKKSRDVPFAPVMTTLERGPVPADFRAVLALFRKMWPGVDRELSARFHEGWCIVPNFDRAVDAGSIDPAFRDRFAAQEGSSRIMIENGRLHIILMIRADVFLADSGRSGRNQQLIIECLHRWWAQASGIPYVRPSVVSLTVSPKPHSKGYTATVSAISGSTQALEQCLRDSFERGPGLYTAHILSELLDKRAPELANWPIHVRVKILRRGCMEAEKETKWADLLLLSNALLRIIPTDPEALLWRGLYHLVSDGDNSAAEDDFSASIKNDPTKFRPFWYRAQLYVILGEASEVEERARGYFENARKDLERAIELNPYVSSIGDELRRVRGLLNRGPSW